MDILSPLWDMLSSLWTTMWDMLGSLWTTLKILGKIIRWFPQILIAYLVIKFTPMIMNAYRAISKK